MHAALAARSVASGGSCSICHRSLTHICSASRTPALPGGMRSGRCSPSCSCTLRLVRRSAAPPPPPPASPAAHPSPAASHQTPAWRRLQAAPRSAPCRGSSCPGCQSGSAGGSSPCCSPPSHGTAGWGGPANPAQQRAAPDTPHCHAGSPCPRREPCAAPQCAVRCAAAPQSRVPAPSPGGRGGCRGLGCHLLPRPPQRQLPGPAA